MTESHPSKHPRMTGVLKKEGTQEVKDPMPWEQIWQDVKVGTKWDIGHTEPELQFLIDHDKLHVDKAKGGERPKALVPGCGRAYAVASLANAGFDATGMDISPTAVAEAQTVIESVKPHAKVVLDDFFTLTPEKNMFDLIYDSTFLCAIPPLKRTAWAAKMAQLIRPGGVLIENIYPIFPQLDATKALTSPTEDIQEGPPFRLSEAVVHNLLSDNFDLIETRPIAKEKRARISTMYGPDVESAEIFVLYKRRE